MSILLSLRKWDYLSRGNEYIWTDLEELRRQESITDKWAMEARKELLKSEKSISNRSKETMEVYGPQGNYIMTKRGSVNRVSMSILEYRKLQKAVVTHNHPSGGSFSFEDLRFLKNTPISELRVAAESGVFYMRKPEKWREEINTTEKMKKEIEKIQKELKPKYRELYNKGDITKIERHRMFSDEVNRRFAERFGIEYGQESYE